MGMGDEDGLGDMDDPEGGDEMSFGDDDEELQDSVQFEAEEVDEDAEVVDEDEEVDESKDEVDEDADEEMVREYVEKVATPSNSEESGGNTKSMIAKNQPGKIEMPQHDEKGMKAKAPKVDDAGNRNVPGGKASKQENGPKTKNVTDHEKSLVDHQAK